MARISGIPRTLMLCLLTGTMVALAPVASAVPAAAQTAARAVIAPKVNPFDHDLIRLINRARAQNRVPALTEVKGLNELAVSWSRQMNSGYTHLLLVHNPHAWELLRKYGAANRTAWAENIARFPKAAASAAALFQMYMRSPGHRGNMLNPRYRYIGTGTINGAHGAWNTIEFTDRVQL